MRFNLGVTTTTGRFVTSGIFMADTREDAAWIAATCAYAHASRVEGVDDPPVHTTRDGGNVYRVVGESGRERTFRIANA